MIKGVLFDLDGTLIDTNNLIIQSFQHTLKKSLGITVKDSDIVGYFGEPLITTLARYNKENAEEMCKIYREFNERMHDELARAFEGVEKALYEIKGQGLKIGVVTSKRREMAERGLKLFNLFHLMDVIITPEDTNRHKPDPEPAIEACRKMDVDPEQTIFVGDSIYDIQCGNAAGCYTCAVKYTIIPIEEINKFQPDFTIDNMSNLVNVIKGIRCSKKSRFF